MKEVRSTIDFPLSKTIEPFRLIPSLLGLNEDLDSSKVEVKRYQHSYKEITFIDLKWESGSLRVAVHNKFIAEFKENLVRGNLNSFKERLQDDELQDKTYRGIRIENVYGYKANITFALADLDSEESIIDWGDTTDGVFIHLERDIEKAAERLSPHLLALGEQFNLWRQNTQMTQTTDVYRSFDVLDHKITVCIDVTPVVADGVSVDREPLTTERLVEFPESDRKYLKSIIRIADVMTQLMETLRKKYAGTGYAEELLTDFLENNLYRSLYQQVSIAIPFNPTTPESQKMITVEVNKVLDALNERDEYLDPTTYAQFTKDENGVSHLSSDMSIAKMWTKYTQSFGQAVSNALVLLTNERLKPFTKLKDLPSDK